MAKTAKQDPAEKAPKAISIAEHNKMILTDRMYTFIGLSINRARAAGDPPAIVGAGEYLRDYCDIKFPEPAAESPAEKKVDDNEKKGDEGAGTEAGDQD